MNARSLSPCVALLFLTVGLADAADAPVPPKGRFRGDNVDPVKQDVIMKVALQAPRTFDLHTKLRVDRRNQVQECIVWRVLDRAIDWFVYREGQYEQLAVAADGVLRSEVFPGLWLDPAAMAAFDLARVLAVLQDGLRSPEHAAFVARLRQAASPKS